MKNEENIQNKSIIGSVLVVGGGIAAIQTALDLANSGYYVHMVEKKSAIGGVMAQLDKTFPTNDCSMCVISPKLVECGRHLNINLMTLTEVSKITGNPGNFSVIVKQNARYVDLDKCTACGECVKVCPIDTLNSFDENLCNRKAIFKLYPQGMPSGFSIDKKGTSPCKIGCPANVSIQGFIALMNEERYDEALALFKKSHPFPGICGRVCHHPCEENCTRNDLDQPLAIRELHRFLADHETKVGDKYISKIEEKPRNEKIAIIGSGPAGLTAADNLLRKGYKVTVFEKMPEPGGMMRYGIPEYRLPRSVIDDEIKVIEKMGAEIKCDVSFGKDITLDSLKDSGYAACFVAIGLHGGRKLGINNEESFVGIIQGVDFLRDVALGNDVDIGKKVIVVGGGNVAIDVALTAKRKGAESVTLVCLEKREEMPAWQYEIEEALQSKIKIVNGFGPKNFHVDESNCISGLQFRMCTDVFDSDGVFSPKYDDSVCEIYNADMVIVSIGQTVNLANIEEHELKISSKGGLEADPITLQTNLDWVFVGGDVFYGPKSIVEAVESGKKAAKSIDRFINGVDLAKNRGKYLKAFKPNIGKEQLKPRVNVSCLDVNDRECNFMEVSYGYSKSEAKTESSRCLKCGICSECYRCVDSCLAGAINHDMEDKEITLNVGSVVIASGFVPFDPSIHKTYAYSNHPNVVTSLEFERILSASGPFAGHMIRPSDRKEPDKIAWLQCVGSRDINLSDHSYCSSVCCMYTNKQTVIAKEHSSKELDTAVFFMDMRTCGKNFEKYYMRAKEEKGVRYIRSKVHTVDPAANDNLLLRYVDEHGNIISEIFDMVVLAVGLAPSEDVVSIAETFAIDLNEHGYAFTSNFTPINTTRNGIFVCGAFQEPKDIPHSVMEASAAACSVGELLTEARGSLIKEKKIPPEIDVSRQKPRVGVFVCNCGINIGGVVNISKIKDYVTDLPNVIHVEDNLFTCSQDTQDNIKKIIVERNINRVVVASCSPRTHESLFQETIRDAGLNSYLFEMANIRDQNTWVHMNYPDKATNKAKDLIKMAVAKVSFVEPLYQHTLGVIKSVLVIGGGVAGMEAAIGFVNQGIKVYLVEQTEFLGGIAHKLRLNSQGEFIKPYLYNLIDKVKNNSLIKLFMNSEVIKTSGVLGNFDSTLLSKSNGAYSTKISHGVTLIATGGKEYVPKEYMYGKNDNILTHFELDSLIESNDSKINSSKSLVFVQCVGSRDDDRPYCSKVCCTHTLKSALTLKKLNPELNIYVIYRDIRSYGFREQLYKEARSEGIIFIRYDIRENIPAVKSDEKGKLYVVVKDYILQKSVQINPDLVVLATAVIPNKNKNLFELFKVPINDDGFLVEAHAKLRPVDSPSEGIFMAGIVHNPKPLDETIAQARAAVARAMTILSKDNIVVGGIIAEVNSDRCAVCLTCVRTCPYNVPFVGEEGFAVIEPVECRGCGTCVSECPGKAIQLKHFTDEQIIAKVDALFIR